MCMWVVRVHLDQVLLVDTMVVELVATQLSQAVAVEQVMYV